MADDPCAPFSMCDGLDAQLLINRTADGPAIGVELGELPFGPVTMQGATLHPYVRWTYNQTWSAKEACLGPARSVLGLAPGETVSITVTHRESVDTTSLVREAADLSNALTRTERRPVAGPPALGGGTAGSSEKAPEAGRLRLATALVRNVIGTFLENAPPAPLHVAVVGGAGQYQPAVG